MLEEEEEDEDDDEEGGHLHAQAEQAKALEHEENVKN
jgi:hypothetical protein